jgi:hypothetical protein
MFISKVKKQSKVYLYEAITKDNEVIRFHSDNNIDKEKSKMVIGTHFNTTILSVSNIALFDYDIMEKEYNDSTRDNRQA